MGNSENTAIFGAAENGKNWKREKKKSRGAGVAFSNSFLEQLSRTAFSNSFLEQ
jgi:hypothetical protein